MSHFLINFVLAQVRSTKVWWQERNMVIKHNLGRIEVGAIDNAALGPFSNRLRANIQLTQNFYKLNSAIFS